MSMAWALEGVGLWLCDQAEWPKKQVAVQFQAMPPAISVDWHISIDDGGVTTAPEGNYYLTETYEIVLGIWKRVTGQFHSDLSGNILLSSDIYRPNAVMLDELERKCIKHLHQNWTMIGELNARYGLPVEGKGDSFRGTLAYQGRTPNQPIGTAVGGDAIAWIGRKLKFRGLMRTQAIGSIG